MEEVKVQIFPEGNKSEDKWGYRVVKDSDQELVYHVKALEIDKHYLLSEKFGYEEGDFEEFGIENKEDQDKADKRMLDRARKNAKKTLEGLVPKLIDHTDK